MERKLLKKNNSRHRMQKKINLNKNQRLNFYNQRKYNIVQVIIL